MLEYGTLLLQQIDICSLKRRDSILERMNMCSSDHRERIDLHIA